MWVDNSMSVPRPLKKKHLQNITDPTPLEERGPFVALDTVHIYIWLLEDVQFYVPVWAKASC